MLAASLQAGAGEEPRGLQVAESEDPWAPGKPSARLSPVLHLLPWRVRRGLGLALSTHMPFPLQEGWEGRKREREGTGRKGGGRKVFKRNILHFSDLTNADASQDIPGHQANTVGPKSERQ